MNFSWSQKQKDLKSSAVKFAQNKLNKGMISRDRDSKFSYPGWKACADFGLLNMFIPAEYGGIGIDLLDIVATLEGIGYGCKDNGLMFSVNSQVWAVETPIYYFGTEEQKCEFLPNLCDGSIIGASAITEPETGADVYALKTKAEKKKDCYVLNGRKSFVTNAPIADVFVVFARTGESKGFSGISAFLVEKGESGLYVEKQLEKMGLRTSPMSDLIFENCVIPEKNLLGKECSGAFVFDVSMGWEKIFTFVNCIGIMERQLDTCVEYVKVRKHGSKPIGKKQSIANKIVEMKMRMEASRLLLYKAAQLKKDNKNTVIESAIAKLFVSEAYIQNSREAIQIFGGYGYMQEYELERELRDALATSISSGTSEIQKNIIAGTLL